MDGQAGLKRAFGQHAAEHLQFEEDFLVVFGDVAGGLQAIVDHLDPAFPALIHRTLQNGFHQIAVSTVHT